MPRIDADLKLDFKDVLLRPKRSSLKSRAEVGPFESRIGAGLFFFFFFFRGGAGEVGERRCTVRPPHLLFCVSGGGWDADPFCSSHHRREGKPAGPLPGQEVSVRGPSCP